MDFQCIDVFDLLSYSLVKGSYLIKVIIEGPRMKVAVQYGFIYQWSSNCSVSRWTFGPAGNIFSRTELTVAGPKTHTHFYLNEFYDKV